MKNQNDLYGNLFNAIMSGKIELVQECMQNCTSRDEYDDEAEAELILERMEEQEEVRRLISSTVWEN